MTANRPDISLIVIFHNAADTIERTLLSLEDQTLKSVEYIFVSDGSTDGTDGIVKRYVMNNPAFVGRTIMIVQPSHQGTAAATFEGIRAARGRYFIRCDADDYIEPDALETLLGVANRTNADVVVSPFILETPKESKIVGFGKKKPVTLNDFAIDTLHFALWNKLISLDVIRDNAIYPFRNIDRWEDLGIVARVMAFDSSIAYVDRPLYHYVCDPDRPTLSRSSRDKLLNDHLQMARKLDEWFVKRGLDKRYAEFLDHLKFCAKVKMLRGPVKEVARWKKTFPEVNRHILSLRHIPLRYRLMFATVAILPTALTKPIARIFSSRATY